jgi:hypothetical protein
VVSSVFLAAGALFTASTPLLLILIILVVGQHLTSSSAAHAGNPVRRGFTAQSQPSLEYWIARLRGR